MNLGILGGGQLARMMALAAYPLNIRCVFLDPNDDACAGPLGRLIIADYDDEKGLRLLANDSGFVTCEFENVPAEALQSLADQAPTFPPPKALLVAQDRLTEKTLFNSLGVETAPFAEVTSTEDLESAIDKLGLPAILKTRRFGYDGKGQAVIRDKSEAQTAWESVGKVASTLEGFVSFSREVSIISVRGRNGETRFYPLVENVHRKGILYLSTVREDDDSMQQQAEAMVKPLIEELDYVGVLVLEFFHVDDRLLANEFAPRVHNSGHWTIEGAYTSQFENHVRAVTGLPLGNTQARCPSAMVNLVGQVPEIEKILAIDGASLHLYDKKPRSGRKIGHVTICARDSSELEKRLESVVECIGDTQ